MNRTVLSRVAICRTRSSALSAPTRSCARNVCCWRGFPLASPLPSIPSAAGSPALFGNFVGTPGLSDCPWSCIIGVCPLTSRHDPPPHPRRVTTGPPGSRARCVRACSGSLTARSSAASCAGDASDVAFRFSLQRRRSGAGFFRG